MPGQSRLFLDFCAGALGAFLPPHSPKSRNARLSPRTGRSWSISWPRRTHPPPPKPRLLLSPGRRSCPHRPAGGLIRRPALHAVQSRHRHCPRPPGHRGRPSPRRHLLAGHAKTTTLPKSTTSPFPPARAGQLAYAHSARNPPFPPAASCSTTPSRRSSSAPRNCSAPPKQPTLSSPPTSPAAPSPRPSPISTRRSSPRRVC